MIDNIQGLIIFNEVANAGSLTGAASQLGLSLALVSKRLAALETQMGVRLFNRTTRRLSLTQEGATFQQHCVRILAEVQQAETVMLESRNDISGLLRVTAPRMFGCRHLTTLAVEFQAIHPQLQIELNLGDEVVDIVGAGIDMAFRFGKMRDSSLIARQITNSELVLCASPDYLQRYGMPQTPESLSQHRCVQYGVVNTGFWVFQHEGNPVSVEINPTFHCNDGNAARNLALAGGGIFLKSLWDVGPDLANGHLVRVLEGYSMPSAPLTLVYPNSKHLSPRVRAFTDYAINHLRGEWEKLRLSEINV